MDKKMKSKKKWKQQQWMWTQHVHNIMIAPFVILNFENEKHEKMKSWEQPKNGTVQDKNSQCLVWRFLLTFWTLWRGQQVELYWHKCNGKFHIIIIIILLNSNHVYWYWLYYIIFFEPVNLHSFTLWSWLFSLPL